MSFMKNKTSWGQSLLRSVGVHESTGWRSLFLVFTILGLIPNFIVLLGCMVEQTKSLYIFQVNVVDLIHATSNITTVSSHDLDLEELPSHWYWGLSGICVTHKNNSKIYCEQSFPPMKNISSMLEFGVKTHTDYNKDKLEDLLAPWTEAMSQLEDDIKPQQETFATMMKFSATLSVLSVIFGLTLASMGIASLTFWRGKPARWMLYIVALIDGFLFTGAGVLALLAMDNGPRAIIKMAGFNQGPITSFIGPGLFALFTGCLFKFVSIGIIFVMTFCIPILLVFLVIYSCQGKRNSKEKEEKEKKEKAKASENKSDDVGLWNPPYYRPHMEIPTYYEQKSTWSYGTARTVV